MEEPVEVPEVKVLGTTRPRKMTSEEQRTRHNGEFHNV